MRARVSAFALPTSPLAPSRSCFRQSLTRTLATLEIPALLPADDPRDRLGGTDQHKCMHTFCLSHIASIFRALSSLDQPRAVSYAAFSFSLYATLATTTAVCMCALLPTSAVHVHIFAWSTSMSLTSVARVCSKHTIECLPCANPLAPWRNAARDPSAAELANNHNSCPLQYVALSASVRC